MAWHRTRGKEQQPHRRTRLLRRDGHRHRRKGRDENPSPRHPPNHAFHFQYIIGYRLITDSVTVSKVRNGSTPQPSARSVVKFNDFLKRSSAAPIIPKSTPFISVAFLYAHIVMMQAPFLSATGIRGRSEK